MTAGAGGAGPLTIVGTPAGSGFRRISRRIVIFGGIGRLHKAYPGGAVCLVDVPAEDDEPSSSKGTKR